MHCIYPSYMRPIDATGHVYKIKNLNMYKVK